MNEFNEKLLNQITKLNPVVWQNKKKETSDQALSKLDITYTDIIDAAERLNRFRPLISNLFPETVNGIIESPLLAIPAMKKAMENLYQKDIGGRLYLKCDSHLKIAGSIKARGGIYEVLKHAETLAMAAGILSPEDNYAKLAQPQFKDFFSRYKIAVGSTGNLGLSIGIISSALGFQVTVHMSADAKEWKKKLLRSKGVTVIEYSEDYSKAVAEGRKQCAADPDCYFIDDENSKDLFLGYSVAALRLLDQLNKASITVDDRHPLYVYLPCGVGGAPGGITFGLKHIFKDNVNCYFVEPTHSPCMILGLLTGKYDQLHVREYGIDNITEADGLAVGSPSKLVSHIAEKLIDGIYTISDDELFKLLALLNDTEGIKIEPSAAAGLLGPTLLDTSQNATHICWATGGLLLPDEIYSDMYHKGKGLLNSIKTGINR
ncbi:D-serine dehydratase [Desulfotomaculum nigrificans CO-1-SRB]|uniref:Probable D-serine dehydratase n=1 Tax=Desulfotomaculum nigrificans (strain DSM 14880 / VKM B-2319 / CO-1-SRB) TaxID=868595 RepID=F6B5B2_DESCC|nr:D-serine ammonia-lyase [Desulfotomaculum nigrificans]AEF94233.1 D-serine dehydratase [Desulfotomaculum nigrificans CO-1-SRB]